MLKKEIKGHGDIWSARYLHYNSIYRNIGRVALTTSNILKGISTKEGMTLEQLPPPFVEKKN